MLVVTQCRKCGGSFQYEKSGSGRLRRYCSIECRTSAATDRERTKRASFPRCRRNPLHCADCGKDMFRGPTSLPDGQARCLPCRRQARAARLAQASMPLEAQECQRCGSFYTPTSRLQHYCSADCRSSGPLTCRHPIYIEAIDNAAKNVTKVATLIVGENGVAGVYCETCSYLEEYVDDRGELSTWVRWDRHHIPLDAQFTGTCAASTPPAKYRALVGPACPPRRCRVCRAWTSRPKYCSSACASKATRHVKPQHPCLVCQAQTTRPKYCSATCKERARFPLHGRTDHVCDECQIIFTASPLARYCGKRCSKRAQHRRHRARISA